MSVSFKLPNGFIENTSKFHREMQVAIALIANEKSGNHVDLTQRHILGIGKYEGGVGVWVKEGNEIRRKEICIRHNSVADDWDRYNNAEKPAELAVVAAINEIVKKVNKNGVDWLKQYSDQANFHSLYDPLRSLYKL